MFDSVRKHQRLLQFILLLLIFPAFAFFGVSGYQQFMADDDSVALVDGSKITRQQFDEARRNQFDRIKQVLGEQADPKLMDSPEVVGGVLDELIAQRALLIEADKRRVSASDERLRENISAIAGLRRPDGSFDMERYRTLLSAQGLTEAMFEARMRQDLSVQAIPDALATSAFTPRAVSDRIAQLQEQTREVRERVFKAADFASQVKPDDAQLKKYYEDNGRAFETQESAKVEYLVLSAEAIASQVVLGEDDLRTYYEQNKNRYGVPEERKASHILVKVEPGADDAARKSARAKAEGLLKQLQGGTDFAALAKANSQDPGSAANGGDLGFFTRENMVKPFADAAFALKEGELSPLVESEFGLHVIKLTGIKPGAVRSFEQVRTEIEGELRKQQASKRFAEAAETFSNLVYEQSDSLQAAAERFKLQIQNADPVTRTGGAKLPPKSPLAHPKLLAALFAPDSIKTRRNTEAVDVGGSTLVSARIVDHRPAQRKPFEDVQAEVRARVVEIEAKKLAVAAGEAALKELRGGAGEQGFSAARTVARSGPPTIAPAALEAVFRASADKLPAFAGADLGADGYGVYLISKVSLPDAEAIEKNRPRYAQQLSQLLGQQAVSDYVESLKARSKVVRHPDRVIAKGEPR